jgi:hypothetical protein
MLFLGLEEEAGEFVQGCFGHPALRALSALPGANEFSLDQFLEVVGNSGLANAEPFPQFADAKAGTLLGTAAMPVATTGEPEKDGQAVRVRQRLEGRGEFTYTHKSIYIDLFIMVKRITIPLAQLDSTNSGSIGI